MHGINHPQNTAYHFYQMKNKINQSPSEDINLACLWRFAIRYKKWLLLVAVAAAIVSACISLLLPNYYRSQALIVPSDSNSIAKGMGVYSPKTDITDYGDQEQSEYLMQILLSKTLALRVLEKFDLGSSYKIKKNGTVDKDLFFEKFGKNVQVRRADFLGVELSVWDKNPTVARDIAQFMIEEVNTLRNEMKQQRTKSALKEAEVSYQRILGDLRVLEDSMAMYAKQYGISAPERQKDRMTQEWARQIAAGNEVAANRLEAKMRIFDEHVSRFTGWKEQAEAKRLLFQDWTEMQEQMRINAGTSVPSIFVIDYPQIPDSKDKPKRSIIVVVFVFIMEFITILVLATKERSHKTRITEPKDFHTEKS